MSDLLQKRARKITHNFLLNECRGDPPRMGHTLDCDRHTEGIVNEFRATVEGCLEAVEEAKNDEADLNEYHDGQNRMCDYVASCIRERFGVWEKE